MPNVFLDLPLPALNGPGGSVNTSGMGSPKTITVVGTFEQATIIVEASVDGGTVFAPIAVFQAGGPEVQVVEFAADFMRVNVSGRKSSLPFAADIDVGAPTGVGQYSAITLPAGNGAGPALNISTFDSLLTVIAGGTFDGASIHVQISEDNVQWAQLTTFTGQGGIASQIATANFIRAFVSGRKGTIPFTGTLAVGATAAGGGGAGVTVEDEGVPIANNPHSIFNFVGGGVTATDVAGVATITVGQTGVTVEDEGVPLAGNPHTTLNFVGSAIAATDAGGGVADVTVTVPTPGVTVQDEGVPIAGNPHTTLNFVGSAIAATDAGGGVADVTVTVTPGVTVQDEGAPIAGNPHSTLNFVGAGIVAADAGGGVASVTVAGGVTVADEGGAIAGNPHSTLNFVGNGVIASDAGGGVATLTIPAWAFSPPEKWGQENIVANQANVALSAMVSTNFDDIKMIRAGSIVGLSTRYTEAITNGTVTVEVTINGAGTGFLIATVGGTGSQTTQAPGLDVYAAGDLVGMRITTDAGFLPITSDVEAWLEVVEAV